MLESHVADGEIPNFKGCKIMMKKRNTDSKIL